MPVRVGGGKRECEEPENLGEVPEVSFALEDMLNCVHVFPEGARLLEYLHVPFVVWFVYVFFICLYRCTCAHVFTTPPTNRMNLVLLSSLIDIGHYFFLAMPLGQLW